MLNDKVYNLLASLSIIRLSTKSLHNRNHEINETACTKGKVKAQFAINCCYEVLKQFQISLHLKRYLCCLLLIPH